MPVDEILEYMSYDMSRADEFKKNYFLEKELLDENGKYSEARESENVKNFFKNFMGMKT